MIEVTPPTRNEDGTYLRDLSYFRLFYATSAGIDPFDSGSYDGYEDFRSNRYPFVGTEGNTYYFRVCSIDRTSNMSIGSSEVSATMPSEPTGSGGGIDASLLVAVPVT